MSSILDHVEQAVPRSTVYGAMRGSPVFIGKYFREINPASNATDYQYTKGERRINFIVASPDKTIFNDLRSAYLRFNIEKVIGKDASEDTNKITEPCSNFIERIVIKMNGTVIEDISNFDRLTSFFKRKLLTREQKNARQREGWDYVGSSVIAEVAVTVAEASLAGDGGAAASALASVINNGVNDTINATQATGRGIQTFKSRGGDAFTTIETNVTGANDICVKMDLSGIMNIQQLLSGYYSPLEIDLYLQDPAVCLSRRYLKNDSDVEGTDYIIKAPRLCMEQIVMSPEYVSAFEAALLANSSAQGIQIPFTTYYSYKQRVKGDATYWIRKPVRFLKAVYFGGIDSKKSINSAAYGGDSYRFCRVTSGVTNITADDTASAGTSINSYQLSIGTKSYRQIDDSSNLTMTKSGDSAKLRLYESEVQFAKSVGHYNDYSTETDELNAAQRVLNNACQGIDLEFSPDNDVLASETTLNSNDVRLSFKSTNATGDGIDVFAFLQYQASIALFPGNETRLLVT